MSDNNETPENTPWTYGDKVVYPVGVKMAADEAFKAVEKLRDIGLEAGAELARRDAMLDDVHTLRVNMQVNQTKVEEWLEGEKGKLQARIDEQRKAKEDADNDPLTVAIRRLLINMKAETEQLKRERNREQLLIEKLRRQSELADRVKADAQSTAARIRDAILKDAGIEEEKKDEPAVDVNADDVAVTDYTEVVNTAEGVCPWLYKVDEDKWAKCTLPISHDCECGDNKAVKPKLPQLVDRLLAKGLQTTVDRLKVENERSSVAVASLSTRLRNTEKRLKSECEKLEEQRQELEAAREDVKAARADERKQAEMVDKLRDTVNELRNPKTEPCEQCDSAGNVKMCSMCGTVEDRRLGEPCGWLKGHYVCMLCTVRFERHAREGF